jgi:hypothetical protein
LSISPSRIYSSLNISSPQSLFPPHRIFFPSISTFADPQPDPDDESVLRHQSYIDMAPETFKAAYPNLARAQFSEDFAGFAGVSLPVLLDRVIIADRGAAQHAGLTMPSSPAQTQPSNNSTNIGAETRDQEAVLSQSS